jgi:hypothetical protein
LKFSLKTNRFLIIFSTLGFSIFVLWVDFLAGPFIRMPVLFALPVIAASWYWGLIAGEALAIGLPVLRLIIEWGINKPWSIEDSIINSIILILTLAFISFLLNYVHEQRTRIKVLQGFLPICSFCKKIRTKEEKWEQMERYISQHSQAEFSHGVCPECAEKHYGALLKQKPELDGFVKFNSLDTDIKTQLFSESSR